MRHVDDVIEIEVRIAADPKTVFGFLTDPAKFVRWLGLQASLHPIPGGIFRVDANGRDVVSGTYVEVVPYRKVVFTWGWEGGGGRVPAGSTTVEITLRAEGDGTLLTLRHSGLSGVDRDKHAGGWSHYIKRLTIVAQGGEPGADPLASADIAHG